MGAFSNDSFGVGGSYARCVDSGRGPPGRGLEGCLILDDLREADDGDAGLAGTGGSLVLGLGANGGGRDVLALCSREVLRLVRFLDVRSEEPLMEEFKASSTTPGGNTGSRVSWTSGCVADEPITVDIDVAATVERSTELPGVPVLDHEGLRTNRDLLGEADCGADSGLDEAHMTCA